jgi:hypothetical protein
MFWGDRMDFDLSENWEGDLGMLIGCRALFFENRIYLEERIRLETLSL